MIQRFFTHVFLLVPRLYIFVDGLLSFIVRKCIQTVFPPRYPVIGACKRRGVCCRNVAVYLSSGFWRFPVLRRIAITWYQKLYNFSYKGADHKEQVVIFQCNYLKDNLCSIHWRRPFICRNYPQPHAFRKRSFIPGCGYSLHEGQH